MKEIMDIKSKFSQLLFIRKQRMNSNGEVPIYLRIRVNGKTVDFSLHRSVKKKDWDSENGLVKGRSSNSKELNSYLFSVKAALLMNYKQLRENNSFVTVEQLKDSYLGISEDKKKKIIELFKEHNNDVEKLEGIDYTPITVKRYATSLERLQLYIKTKHNADDIYIDKINHSFIKRYEAFIKTEYNVSHNTAIKFLKHLKKILRIAQANGWLGKDPFLNIKMSEKKTDRGFLTDEDLEKIYELEFKTERLEEIRDCFLFSCFTGLAYSDLARLTKDNIVIGTDGNRWIKINRKKTNIKSSIPLLARTETILNKYKDNAYCQIKGVLLPVRSNQKMNEYLKEIKNLAKIKLELTTHLARHTFATTITLNNDVPIETVSKMLGHSSISTTKIYARLLDKKVGRDMSKLNAIYKS